MNKSEPIFMAMGSDFYNKRNHMQYLSLNINIAGMSLEIFADKFIDKPFDLFKIIFAG